MKTLSKTEKLSKALASGSKLTSKQIATRFKISNPTAHISYLRSKGMAVEHVVVNGVGKYSMI